ncbi:unnamed protein product, partial [Effrenium voratum]
ASTARSIHAVSGSMTLQACENLWRVNALRASAQACGHEGERKRGFAPPYQYKAPQPSSALRSASTAQSAASECELPAKPAQGGTALRRCQKCWTAFRQACVMDAELVNRMELRASLRARALRSRS